MKDEKRKFLEIDNLFNSSFSQLNKEINRLHNNLYGINNIPELASPYASSLEEKMNIQFKDSIYEASKILSKSAIEGVTDSVSSYLGLEKLSLDKLHNNLYGINNIPELASPYASSLEEKMNIQFKDSIYEASKILSKSAIGGVTDSVSSYPNLKENFSHNLFRDNMLLAEIETLSSEIFLKELEESKFTLQNIEELKQEIVVNNIIANELKSKVDDLTKYLKIQKNNTIEVIIVGIITGLIVSIFFTYFIQPSIDLLKTNFSLNKFQVKKILLPEIEKMIKPNELSKFRVVIAKPYLNVRNKAKMKSKVIYHLSTGDIVEILEKNKNWTFIKKYDSNTDIVLEGWVSTRYLYRIK